MCYTTDENDDLLYRDFLVSAHTGGCFMTCTNWCSDVSASFFCIAFTNSLIYVNTPPPPLNVEAMVIELSEMQFCLKS